MNHDIPYPNLRDAACQLVRAFRLSRFQQRGRRWTQAEAAAWWGVSERTWRRYEAGDTGVPLALVKRIARSGTAKRLGS